ncbi:TetR/AcrR family transcriptional regulator [Kineococcus sp. NPDC059986]|uniref:TetR/AcrR family transcriptional regulator n=1 Tax=Kineococcus sp. NPDC059986 TaxID=3155538 RepID=UPI00344FA247
MTEATTDRDRVVAAADRLFYARGVQSVGMDAVRTEAGLPLKRLYAAFGSKDELVVAVLAHRSRTWDDGVAGASAGARTPRERLLAVYDFLDGWFGSDDFRGCAFINAYGELGGVSPAVAQAVRDQKQAFARYVEDLVADLGADRSLAAQLVLLAEGAQTTAAITGADRVADHARAAAEVLIDAAVRRDRAS